jgi:hypothetical protein
VRLYDTLSFFSERSRSTSSPRSGSVPQAAPPGQMYAHLKYLSRFIYQLHEIFNKYIISIKINPLKKRNNEIIIKYLPDSTVIKDEPLVVRLVGVSMNVSYDVKQMSKIAQYC